MSIRWKIDDKVRAEIHFFTGVAFAGNRDTVRIFVGGRKQGPEIDGSRLKSIGVIAPLGTRIVLCSSDADEGWERHPWRAFVVRKGTTFRSKGGGTAVQIPDLDQVDRWDAPRSDPDTMTGLTVADSLEEGEGWTFGRLSWSEPLKGNVKCIRIDLVDTGE